MIGQVRSEQAVVAHACHGHRYRYRPSQVPVSGTGHSMVGIYKVKYKAEYNSTRVSTNVYNNHVVLLFPANTQKVCVTVALE